MAMSGRRFRTALEFSRASRQAALDSIREAEFGYVFATIGGKVRGRERLFPSRDRAEEAVHLHYDRAMMEKVTKRKEVSRCRQGRT